MKQVASHFGGTRNGLAVSWPARIADAGGLRTQFHHVVDIAPTILEAAGVPWPDQVDGIEQMPVHGTPMGYSFDDETASSRAPPVLRDPRQSSRVPRRLDGFVLPGRVPWIRLAATSSTGPTNAGSCTTSPTTSLRVSTSQRRFESWLSSVPFSSARLEPTGSFPRDAVTAGWCARVPHSLDGVTKMTYTTAHVRMPESSVVNLKNASHEITAELIVPEGALLGVIACQGGNMAGWSMYLDTEGVAAYVYNLFGHVVTTVRDRQPLRPDAMCSGFATTMTVVSAQAVI